MGTKEMSVEEYLEVLKKYAERIGLLFNSDETLVRSLAAGLLTNKNRYGYPSCPCRLACEDFAGDKDIICPCVYAEPDIAEYGKCYCGLYVSREFLDGKIDREQVVPERRPAEKLWF